MNPSTLVDLNLLDPSPTDLVPETTEKPSGKAEGCGRSPQLGSLITLTGPSGVGKGTLLSRLLEKHPDLHYSISVTTRDPRPGEVDGVDYYFCSRDEFLALRAANGLLEWAEYANNFYGTPVKPVRDKLEQGFDVVLEIELDGVRQVAQHWPQAVRIFVQPPSMTELERRLRARGSESESSIQRRLTKARAEMAAIEEFDHVVVNDQMEQALDQLEGILFTPSV
ncbi:MAG: guanylate kinase [Cyanophyceae cyanobacterium]|jgi:guanylate kinase